MTAKRKPAVRAQGGLSVSFQLGSLELSEYSPNSQNFQQITRAHSSDVAIASHCRRNAR
jgi:hypothetical protein